MKNPWTQQVIAQSQQQITYGISYNILNKKYQLQSENKDQFHYISIIKNANNIQEKKQRLAIQIIDQQFGDMIDPKKFEQRMEQLDNLEQIINQVLQCLLKCKICVQHNNDTNDFIKNDGSVYMNIPFQYKTQFIQLLRLAQEKQCELIDPDQQIIQQQRCVKELDEQQKQIEQIYSQIIQLMEQLN
ncbi:unnamed protein product [Paramecium sonneborni]|uniref:Uncharacterized protein n=1 Tax=Paramecium sonneborni TaxID=65129 RepID=A0A8S1KF21_9CILI|nr:unnamed protein product [Paramecium sonneborni]